MSAVDGLDLDPALRERRTASDYVADALRVAILEGKFADGEELNQVQLASHFKVSRVPDREALRRLQAEGLVSAEAHRRAAVVGSSRKRIEEIFEIRAVLEGHLLEKGAPAIDAVRVAALRKLCGEMERTRDHGRWLEKNLKFHRLLIEPAGSRTAIEVVEQLSRQVQRYVRQSGRLAHSDEAGRQHRAILAALESGDAHEAGRLLREHILGTLDRVAPPGPAGPQGGAQPMPA